MVVTSYISYPKVTHHSKTPQIYFPAYEKTPQLIFPRAIQRFTNINYPRSHQALTRVQMLSTNRIGQATGNKAKIKCRLDRGQVMLLTTYQLVNLSKFDESFKPIDGYDQDRTIVKSYTANLIQQYGVRAIFGKWNNQNWDLPFIL